GRVERIRRKNSTIGVSVIVSRHNGQAFLHSGRLCRNPAPSGYCSEGDAPSADSGTAGVLGLRTGLRDLVVVDAPGADTHTAHVLRRLWLDRLSLSDSPDVIVVHCQT